MRLSVKNIKKRKSFFFSLLQAIGCEKTKSVSLPAISFPRTKLSLARQKALDIFPCAHPLIAPIRYFCRTQVLLPELIFFLIPAAPLLRIFLSSSCVDICCGHSSPALSSAPRWLEKSWLPMVISSRRRPWGLQIPRRGAPALVAALPPRSFCSPCIYGARRPSPWLALRPAAAPVNFLLAGQALAPAGSPTRARLPWRPACSPCRAFLQASARRRSSLALSAEALLGLRSPLQLLAGAEASAPSARLPARVRPARSPWRSKPSRPAQPSPAPWNSLLRARSALMAARPRAWPVHLPAFARLDSSFSAISIAPCSPRPPRYPPPVLVKLTVDASSTSSCYRTPCSNIFHGRGNVLSLTPLACTCPDACASCSLLSRAPARISPPAVL